MMKNIGIKVDGISEKEIRDIAMLCRGIREYKDTYGHRHVQLDGDEIVIFSESDPDGKWYSTTLGFDGMRITKCEIRHFGGGEADEKTDPPVG